MNLGIFEKFPKILDVLSIQSIDNKSEKELNDILQQFIEKISNEENFELFLELFNHCDDKEKSIVVALSIYYSPKEGKWLDFYLNLPNKEKLFSSFVAAYICGFKDYFIDVQHTRSIEFMKKQSFLLLLGDLDKKESKPCLDFSFDFPIDIGEYSVRDILYVESIQKNAGMSLLYSLKEWEVVITQFFEVNLGNNESQKYFKLLKDMKMDSRSKVLQYKMDNF